MKNQNPWWRSENLSVTYGPDQQPIRFPSKMEFYPGEIVALHGPSGCGKSTLLHLIKGVIPHLMKAEISGTTHCLYDEKEILYLLQNPYSQLVTETVKEDLTFTMENYQIPQASMQQNLTELVEDFHLGHLYERKNATLSGGEAQRVCLASIMGVKPKVVLFDEPSSFLDAHGRELFSRQLQKLKKQGISVILSTHHLKEVKDIVDRVVDFSPTRLVCQDFTLYPGQILGLNGPNGSGKSTFFDHLARIKTSPHHNSQYFFDDRLITQTKELLSLIGLIPQNPESLFFFDTVKEELESDDPKKNWEVLKKLNLPSDCLKRSPFTLSLGEKRRLSVYLGAPYDSSKMFLFYDEPTFGLDQKNIQVVREIILQHQRRGAIQIIASHDLLFLQGLCDEIRS